MKTMSSVMGWDCSNDVYRRNLRKQMYHDSYKYESFLAKSCKVINPAKFSSTINNCHTLQQTYHLRFKINLQYLIKIWHNLVQRIWTTLYPHTMLAITTRGGPRQRREIPYQNFNSISSWISQRKAFPNLVTLQIRDPKMNTTGVECYISERSI